MVALKKTKKNPKRKRPKLYIDLPKKSSNPNKFQNMVCGPTRKNQNRFYTCYTKNELTQICRAWNKRNPSERIDETKPPRTIWNALRGVFSNTCENEKCWIKTMVDKYKIQFQGLETLFAPFHPIAWNKKPRDWLTNYDIKRVMKQYENLYKSFAFIGPSPVDYDHRYEDGDCVWNDLCQFSLESYLGKKKYIGVIFNLDDHKGDGSHWVSVFIHIPKREVYFYDSVGSPPPQEIQTFMDTVVKQSKELNIEFTPKINTTPHQNGDTECGVYSIHFIISMITGKSFEAFTSQKLTDDDVFKFRKFYFNRPN